MSSPLMPQDYTRRLSAWVPPLAYMAVIFWFSSQSDPVPEVTARVWDKLLHTFGYSALAVLFGRALLRERLPLARAVVLAIVLTSTYGATDEFHQSFVPGRMSDVRDWVADSVGGIVGAACLASARHLRSDT